MLQKFDPRNRDLIVNVGGRLTHRNDAAAFLVDGHFHLVDLVVRVGDLLAQGAVTLDVRIRLEQGRWPAVGLEAGRPWAREEA